MIVVVDASVAIKWFVSVKPDEEHADRALRILEQTVGGSVRMVQPPHFIAEVTAVLARLKPDVAQDDLFDTLYHAVALQTPGAMLVTSDARYFARARAEGRIALLSEFSVA